MVETGEVPDKAFFQISLFALNQADSSARLFEDVHPNDLCVALENTLAAVTLISRHETHC